MSWAKATGRARYSANFDCSGIWTLNAATGLASQPSCRILPWHAVSLTRLDLEAWGLVLIISQESVQTGAGRERGRLQRAPGHGLKPSTGIMADPAPLPPQNTFGRGPPVHRESLASSTALGQDLAKTRLITEWQRQVEDGREISSTFPPKDELDPEADPSEYKDPEDFYKDIKAPALPPSVPPAVPAVGRAQPPTPNQRPTKVAWNWDPKSRDFVRTRGASPATAFPFS